MTARWTAGALAMALGCASTPPVEPARPAEVPGLAPLPLEGEGTTPAPAAAVGAGPGRPTSTTLPAASAAPDPVDEGPANAASGPAVALGCSALLEGRAVRRSALSRTLDAGLGNWLRGVDIEPKMDRGRFQGWLIRAIYAGDPCWTEVDLRAGDVVARVNRRPIERPEEAQAVWTALRGSGEIVVEFVRAGKTRTLRFPVVDDRP